ncbi:MAG TPA: flagellar biosynthetic protein FliR [Steroidobacteraceae bacterium]|nr:flagellar biosynthetic protein FliR [Steroidobacteraceae bacterium]
MITLNATQLNGWLAGLFWPFVRIGSCFMVAPAFGATSVPARVRIVLAGAVALLVAPLVTIPAVTPLSAAGAVITVQQVIIGAALGFSLQILFEAVSLGGELLANSMGLSLAFNLDPQNGASTPTVGQLYTVLVTLIFLVLNGHLALIRTLVDGFHTLPIGTSGLGANGLWTVADWGSELFSGALAVALPGVTALLIANLAFGVVSRAAPTLNIFSVGLPVSLVFGLLAIIAGLPALESSFIRLLAAALDFLRHLSGA